MWTFGGTVPGTTFRGKVGDVFNVTLYNDGTLGHSIDFHASKVAWNDEMRTIQPGESLVYQYEAKHAGVYMYHCGTPPALHHVGNGMFGAIIIDPPDLEPVDTLADGVDRPGPVRAQHVGEVFGGREALGHPQVEVVETRGDQAYSDLARTRLG